MPTSRSDEPACDGCGAEDGPARTSDTFRCVCGSLLARFVGGRIELKCRRCKRAVLIDAEPEGAE